MWNAIQRSMAYKAVLFLVQGVNQLLFMLFEHGRKKDKGPLKWLSLSAIHLLHGRMVKGLHQWQDRLHQAGQRSFIFGPEGLGKGIVSKLLNALDPYMVLIPVNFLFIDYTLRQIPALSSLSNIWDEMALVAFIAYIMARPLWVTDNYKWRYSGLDILVNLFIAVGVALFCFESPETNVAIDGFRAVYQYVFWYYIFRQLIWPSNRGLVLASFAISGAFLGWHSVYQVVRKVPMPGNWVDSTETITTRAFSIIGSPNILSAVFVLLLPIVAAYAWTQKRGLMKWIAALAVPAMLVGLLYTYSRQAYLALAGAVGIYFVLFYPKVVKYLIVLAGGALLALRSIRERLFYLFTAEYWAKSAKGGRLIRYEYAIEQWLEKPWFGQGMGRFGGAVATKYELTPFYVDSYFFKTLGEMGLVGLTALLTLLITTVFYLKRIINAQKTVTHMILMMGIFIGILGLVLQNAVENIFEVPLMIVWFWAVVSIALTFDQQNEY